MLMNAMPLVGSSLGAMLVPMAAGFLFQKLGASLLVWIIFGGNCVLIAIYFTLALFLPHCAGITVTSTLAFKKTEEQSAVLHNDKESQVFQLLPSSDEAFDEDEDAGL